MFHKQDPLNDHRRIYAPAAKIAASLRGDFAEVLNFLHPKPTQKQRRMRPVRVTRARKGKK